MEDTRKFTPAAELIDAGKIAFNSLTKTCTLKEPLAKDEEVLMSASEFNAGMKNLKGVKVTITPDGKQPVFPDVESAEI